jgi:hypothetical protein
LGIYGNIHLLKKHYKSDLEDLEMVMADLKHMLRGKFLKERASKQLFILNKRRNILTDIDCYENEK